MTPSKDPYNFASEIVLLLFIPGLFGVGIACAFLVFFFM